MTGQTTARAAGGSELAVAWVQMSGLTEPVTVLFEPGMTWEQYVNSEYVVHAVQSGSATPRKFGFEIGGGQVKFSAMSPGYTYVSYTAWGSPLNSSDQIEANHTYGETT